MQEIETFLFDSEIAFVFKWISKTKYGEINPNKNEVAVNMRLMLFETILHEYYHHKYPQKTEQEVEQLARNKIKRLTVKQICEITDRFVLVWGFTKEVN